MISVEALGIEERWREVGFGGSRGVSFARSGKTSESRYESMDVRSVSLGLVVSDCSNEVSRISEAIAALVESEVSPHRTLMAFDVPRRRARDLTPRRPLWQGDPHAFSGCYRPLRKT